MLTYGDGVAEWTPFTVFPILSFTAFTFSIVVLGFTGSGVGNGIAVGSILAMFDFMDS
jgi:hypothetical protein